LQAHGHALFERMWEGLGAIPGVTRYGPGPDRPRTPTISFTVQGVPSEQVTRALVRRGVFTSHGDFYASTVVALLGHAEDGLVRAGAACYTTDDEVDRLVAGVRELARA
jgi:selenocysteine lyase/cysteine desulfurase